MIEIWRANKKESYLYTDDSQFAGNLRRNNREIKYEKNGVTFAWQFLLPTDKAKKLTKRSRTSS